MPRRLIFWAVFPSDGVRFVGEQNVLQPKPQSGKLTELIILRDAIGSCVIQHPPCRSAVAVIFFLRLSLNKVEQWRRVRHH
jgi:hypothetical protein